jgi:hypothetical protein
MFQNFEWHINADKKHWKNIALEAKKLKLKQLRVR